MRYLWERVILAIILELYVRYVYPRSVAFPLHEFFARESYKESVIDRGYSVFVESVAFTF